MGRSCPPEAGQPWAEKPKNMYYVYIIYSEKIEKIYKGSTNDLIKRIKEHNNKKVKSTKNGNPWKLIYYEAFINKADALIEEKFLKTGRGRERLKLLLKNYFRKNNNRTEGCQSG